MRIRIIQWNISFKCDANKIAAYILNNIDGPTIINLQEVLEPTHRNILSILEPDSVSYSLDLRRPGRHEGKNRKMGISTYVFGGEITKSELLSRSVFPERTLFTEIMINDVNISVLNFHSITGVDYKKAKSSNFASIADFIHDHQGSLDFFTCDANEPKVDSLDASKIEFFDNRDKGKNASLLFGGNKVHSLDDSYKTYLTDNNIEIEDSPLAVSHVISKKYKKRYDHIYKSSDWKVNMIEYPYDDSLAASSDHSMVIADFSRE